MQFILMTYYETVFSGKEAQEGWMTLLEALKELRFLIFVIHKSFNIMLPD